MRFLGWLGGLVVVAMVVVGTGAVIASHRLSVAPRALTAARQQVADPTAHPQSDAGDLIPRTNPSPPSPSPPTAMPPAAPAPAPASAPPPAVGVSSKQQALINQDRAANGLGPLTWNGCLYNVAVSNARRIAAQGYLSHTNGPQQDLGCGLGHQAGENIGYWTGGVNDSQLNTMFMNSPEHRANILGPYRYVATTWVVAPNGYGYVAVEFS